MASADTSIKEEGSQQRTVDLSIKVAQCRNIKGSKGEHVNSFVRVQFADYDFKDSEVIVDNGNPQFNFTWTLPIHVDENAIDSFWNKKVTIQVIESLPKEKTQVLGTVETTLGHRFLNYPVKNLDEPDAPLGPLPSLSFKDTMAVSYLNPKMLQTAAPVKGASEDAAISVPEVDLEISISQLLIAPEVAEQGNFLTFKIEDILPIPDEWSLKEGSEKDLNSNIFTYTLNFMLPSGASSERLISIPMGLLVNTESAAAHEPCSTTIYYSKGSAATGPGCDQPKQDENASNTNSGNEQQSFSANGPKKVSWAGVRHVVWLAPEAVQKMRERIQQKIPLEIEFVRELQAKFAHVTDIHVNKYRGKVTLDGSSLLYPRVIGLKGRYALDVYTGELRPNTSATDPAASTANASAEKEGGKKNKGKDDGAHNLYKALNTTLGLEIYLEKPLLDRKKLQPVNKSVRDFIPKRSIPAHLIYEKRSKKADEYYHTQIKDLVHKLAKEYEGVIKTMYHNTSSLGAKMFSNESLDSSLDDVKLADSDEDEQKRRKAFMYHLNKSGAYFHMKEELKSAVADVVRERFKQKSPFAHKSEMQLFLSEIYVYLSDQMHIAVNKIFDEASGKIMQTPNSPTFDSESLKRFADTAESDGLLYMADIYHKERLAKFESSLDAWFDYGCFCMRSDMVDTGKECFKHILSMRPTHVPSLLAYGAILSEEECFEESRVYFHTALQNEPQSLIGLVLMGIYYGLIEEEEEAEKAQKELQSVLKSKPASVASSYSMEVAEFLVKTHAGQLAEKVLSDEIVAHGPNIPTLLLLTKLEIQRKNYKVAHEHLQEALKLKQDSPDVWSGIGNIYYLQKNWKEAQNAYETVLTLSQDASDMPMVYARLGGIYLQLARFSDVGYENETTKTDMYFFRQAKVMFMRAVSLKPSARAWLGVGKSCLGLNELQEAEDALSEANVLNNHDSEVWASLGLLCLRTKRRFEANQCIAQMLRSGLRDAFTLKQVGLALLEAGETSPATECLRLSLEYLIEEENLIKTRVQQKGVKVKVVEDEKSKAQSSLESSSDDHELQVIKKEIEKVKSALSKALSVDSSCIVNNANQESESKQSRSGEKKTDIVNNLGGDIYGARPMTLAK